MLFMLWNLCYLCEVLLLENGMVKDSKEKENPLEENNTNVSEPDTIMSVLELGLTFLSTT